MTDKHPITPPPELVQQLYGLPQMRAIEAAYQAGADQELEACCEWLEERNSFTFAEAIRLARRPQPPTDKKLALHELGEAYDKGKIDGITYDTIRRALEALPE